MSEVRVKEEDGDGLAGPISHDEKSPRTVHGFNWILVVLAISSSLFLYALDNTIVANIVPAIINDLGHATELAWLSVGFTVGGLCLLLSMGKIYALSDPKWIYILSVVLFLAGSALCGAAPNMPAMIVGRVLAGIGGNGVYLGTVTLLSLNTSEQERPAYLSLNGLTWGLGTVLGPIVGGAFEKVTWRWAFYINLCIGALWAPVWLFLLPSTKRMPGIPFRTKLASFDFLGTVLVVGALLPLVLAINFGGTLFSWNSGASIALFVISGLLMIIFLLQQGFTIATNPTDRLFPIHFLKNKDAVLLAIIAAASDVTTFVPIYYIPLYFQFVRGDDSIQSAVRLLPYITFLSATILANGYAMGKFGYVKPWYVVGSALALIGSALLSIINIDTGTAQIYGFEILLGIGTGCFVQAGYAVLFAMLEPADLAFATSYMMLAQLSGITFGLAIASAIFVNTAFAGLQDLLPGASERDIQSAIEGSAGTFLNSLSPEMRQRALDILVGSLTKTFIPCYVSAALCLVLSIFLKRTRLSSSAASR